MKQHYPVRHCYKILIMGPDCSMWSCNVNDFTRQDIIHNLRTKLVDNPRLLEYKMGVVSSPAKTRPNSFKALSKVFACDSVDVAEKNIVTYLSYFLPVVIVSGYAGNPILTSQDENSKMVRRFRVKYYDPKFTGPFLLCDWFLPISIVKRFEPISR